VATGRDGNIGPPLLDVTADPAQVPAPVAINTTLVGRTENLHNPFTPKPLAHRSALARLP
jgi:hypothetical protein